MSELRGRALALKALEYIEAHPEEWDQETWRCGTQCCIAGHVARIAGCTWANPRDDEEDFEDVLTPDGTWRLTAQEAARQLLGLSYVGADYLFSHANGMSDLRRFIDEFLPESVPVRSSE